VIDINQFRIDLLENFLGSEWMHPIHCPFSFDQGVPMNHCHAEEGGDKSPLLGFPSRK
jgi:hypothetical protein